MLTRLTGGDGAGSTFLRPYLSLAWLRVAPASRRISASRGGGRRHHTVLRYPQVVAAVTGVISRDFGPDGVGNAGGVVSVQVDRAVAWSDGG